MARAKLEARAVAVADRAHQAIGILATLDESVLANVFGQSSEQLRSGHAYGIFGRTGPDAELPNSLNACVANMLRLAAALRKQNAAQQGGDPRTSLLIDDLQVLHREVDFLQKFVLGTDEMTVLARAAYARRYMERESDAAPALGGPELVEAPPAEVASQASPTPAPPAAISFVVTCSRCGQRFAAPARLAGTEVPCLKCGQPLTVSAKQPASAEAASDNPPLLTETPTEWAVAKIPVECPHCRGQFLAQPQLAGRTLACPSCGKSLSVPRAAPGPEQLLALDEDPLADLGNLSDYATEVYATHSPVTDLGYPAGQLPGSRTRRPQEEELPRWIWYAMGSALGLCALVFLIILLTSIFR